MNYRDRMKWLTTEIRKRIGAAEVVTTSTRNAELLKVTAGLFRCCLEQVEALSATLAAEKFEGSFVIQRAIWEYWKEFEFLVARDSRDDDAIRFEVNTVLDVLETLRALPEPDDDALPDTERWLARLEDRYADIVVEMRRRREKRRGHWSGKGRSKIFGPPGAPSIAYRALSWQTHPELAVFREVNVEVHNEHTILRVVPETIDRTEVAERAAYTATGMLWYFWCEFAQLWQMEPFSLPDARASA
jgi:hypothetical protein